MGRKLCCWAASASQRTGEETVLATEAKIILAAEMKRRCERSEHLSYVYISIFATFQQNILFFVEFIFSIFCVFLNETEKAFSAWPWDWVYFGTFWDFLELLGFLRLFFCDFYETVLNFLRLLGLFETFGDVLRLLRKQKSFWEHKSHDCDVQSHYDVKNYFEEKYEIPKKNFQTCRTVRELSRSKRQLLGVSGFRIFIWFMVSVRDNTLHLHWENRDEIDLIYSGHAYQQSWRAAAEEKVVASPSVSIRLSQQRLPRYFPWCCILSIPLQLRLLFGQLC